MEFYSCTVQTMKINENNILISIVIPAYNYADRLPAAIYSVLKQLRPEFHELIVINDGSTDGTEDVLSNLRRESLVPFTIINQKNSGSAAVRNVGIKVTKGDYLIFLDADDAMSNGALSLIEDHIKHNPQTQMIIGGYVSIIEKEGKERITLPGKLPNKAVDRVKAYLIDKRISLANGATVMHRSVFDNGLYPEQFRCVEDLPVFTQALANNNCTVLAEPLALIYRHESSLRNDAILSEQVGMQIVEEVFHTGRLPKEALYLAHHFKAQRALSLFRSFYCANLKKQAKAMYLTALKERWTSIFKLSYTRKAFKLFFCE